MKGIPTINIHIHETCSGFDQYLMSFKAIMRMVTLTIHKAFMVKDLHLMSLSAVEMMVDQNYNQSFVLRLIATKIVLCQLCIFD